MRSVPRSESAGTTAIMLWSACGAMLMAGAANLIAIFLGLELLSLGLYALCAAVDRKSARESALKYLILSSTATGFLLFGSALLFGATGSVMLADFVNPALASNPLFWMGGGMFLIGLAFKLSLVPFHTWTPDVFEGAPLPVTAFMSVVTKAGTLGGVRAVHLCGATGGRKREAPAAGLDRRWHLDDRRQRGYACADRSQTVARVFGHRADRLHSRRDGRKHAAGLALRDLLSHGVRLHESRSIRGGRRDFGSTAKKARRLSSYRGLARRRPWLAAAMTVFLLALSGLPPTAGFLGKILILAAGVADGYVWLAAALIVGTAISLYAYAKIVLAMYAPREARARADLKPVVPLAWLSAALCAALVVIMAFYPLVPEQRAAARSLGPSALAPRESRQSPAKRYSSR